MPFVAGHIVTHSTIDIALAARRRETRKCLTPVEHHVDLGDGRFLIATAPA